jgi:hypothetical protein
MTEATPGQAGLVERLRSFVDGAELLGGHPEDEQMDAEFGRYAIAARHDVLAAAARIEELERALRDIRDQDPTENALDPQWAARIARQALNPKAPND